MDAHQVSIFTFSRSLSRQVDRSVILLYKIGRLALVEVLLKKR